MLSRLKRWLVGEPLATAQASHERLSKRVALAVFSSDALSSVAYATEEILLVLAAAAAFTGGESFGYVLPISGAIALLLWLVGLSYRQTIKAYPTGGGAYIVAKDNLGINAGLTAAAALLVDYVLTVAVSVAAGVEAVTSACQGTELAWLIRHKEAVCLLAIAGIALANLRGLRESGALFSVPTYLFVVGMMAMIVWGLFRHVSGGVVAEGVPADLARHAEGYPGQPVTLFLLLGAFSNGCSALTGVEAISNGVPAFRKPESRNAAVTLIWMVTLLSLMFLGTSVLAHVCRVTPRSDETVISQIARAVFPGNLAWAYYLIQGATAAILILAANTSFADFPRLASLMARDGYLPRQLAALGDRLVFSNGIVLLAVFSGFLAWLFRGDTSRLIPLYAVGVFLSFTLSQAGMVRHWWRAGHALPAPSGAAEPAPPRHWRVSLLINALGATATALVLTVFILTKFVHGAWIVVALVPLLILMFKAIHAHYQHFLDQLAPETSRPPICRPNSVIIPVTRVHRGITEALEYSLSVSQDVRAVFVNVDAEETARAREDWKKLQTQVPLEVLDSPYRAWVGVVLGYVNEVQAEAEGRAVSVVLPEFVSPSWWQEILHNQSVLLLKTALLYRQGLIVTSVPYHLP